MRYALVNCANCDRSRREEWHGYTARCRTCAARSLAQTPQYRDSAKQGALTREYRQLLAQYGLEHAEVREVAGQCAGVVM